MELSKLSFVLHCVNNSMYASMYMYSPVCMYVCIVYYMYSLLNGQNVYIRPTLSD